jgi:hypothetical protein
VEAVRDDRHALRWRSAGLVDVDLDIPTIEMRGFAVHAQRHRLGQRWRRAQQKRQQQCEAKRRTAPAAPQ